MLTHLKDTIKQLAKKQHKEIVSIRRHLHKYPELSFQEYNTSKFITEQLKKNNIPIQKSFSQTGLVATLYGKNPTKKTIALRADIDALPIQELNKAPYASVNENIMHACGHDVHTASLIGVANLLHQLKEEFEGTIKCIFQPAEERLPGGAIGMIEKGILENPKVEHIIAQHVDPLTPIGKVKFVAGKFSANTDSIYITVKGKGGHAALPTYTVNPLSIAAEIIASINKLYPSLATHVDGIQNQPTYYILSFGKLIALGATGVVPEEATLTGTLRTLDDTVRSNIKNKIYSLSTEIATKAGGEVEIDIQSGYPSMENEPTLTHQLEAAAKLFLGEENVQKGKLQMYGEDFAYYTKRIPGCMYELGVQNIKQNINSGLHTSKFDVDEKALEISVGLMAWLALYNLHHTL